MKKIKKDNIVSHNIDNIINKYNFFNNYKQKNTKNFLKNIFFCLLSKNDNKEKAMPFIEIIFSTNRFYAILSLNTILEKKLENDQNKILKYFNILEDLNISKDQKISYYLKSLYLINNSRLEDGKKILEN